MSFVELGNITYIDYVEEDGVKKRHYREYDKDEVFIRDWYEEIPQPQPTPVIEDKTLNITREEFDLLDVTYADTIYYITEEDRTLTIIRGEE